MAANPVNYYIIYDGDTVSESSQRIVADTNIGLISWKNKELLTILS